MGNVLQKIVADKRQQVTAQKQDFPASEFEQQLTTSERDFYAALSGPNTGFILECKKASPSKGLIRDDFDPEFIADVYKHYASCISVLTDEKYFQGKHDYLKQVRARVHQPVICKDFFVDPYQVKLARYYGADAVLLMLSVLDDNEYRELAELAHSLGMAVLTEVSNEEETHRAVALNAKLIGINNRNLRDLSTDLARTEELVPLIPGDRIIISESGIYTHQDVKRLARVANGFLVGSSLMAERDLDMACRKLILGHNKVCGLTREQDVLQAYQQGAVYGGLIFAEQSKRKVTPQQASELVKLAPLNFIGVFVDQTEDFVAEQANQLGLFAVQLHGGETPEYIARLKSQINCRIIKALPVEDALPEMNLDVDAYLLDSKNQQGFGGTGESFDWSLLNPGLQSQVFLAGGLGPHNIKQAASLNLFGLDINSGVESAPGKKDHQKLAEVFQQLRDY